MISESFSKYYEHVYLDHLVDHSIERVVAGLMLSAAARRSIGITKISRYTSIGMGSLAIAFAIFALISPQFASATSLTLLSPSISLIFNGFGRHNR